MKKILIIARHEYWVNLRRPDFIIMTLLVPLLGLIALIIGAFFGGQAGSALVQIFDIDPGLSALVDHSGRFTPILPQFQEEYIPYSDETVARTALENEMVRRIIVVPPTYPQSEDVVVVTAGSRFSESGTGDLRSFFITHLVQDIDDDVLRARLADPYDAQVENINEESRSSGGIAEQALNFVVPFLFSMLLIITVFVSSGYLLRSVAEEKSSRVIEIVLSSVTPQQLLAGKVLGLGALGLTQVFVWIASAFGLSGGLAILVGIAVPLFARTDIFLLAIAYYILGFTVYAVLMGAIGTLGTNFQESQQISGIFSLIAALPMMLMGVIFSNPNGGLARAISWFPLTAPTTMMLRLPLTEVPRIDIVVSILVLLATVPLVVWLGAKIFRLGMLMYGKRPGIVEIVRLLRHA